MKRHAMRRLAATLALAAAAGTGHAAIKVYDATELSYDSYRIVKRLWVESWRTAIGVPHQGTREAAVEQLLAAAVSAGADAVVNLYCVGGERSSAPGFYCYGDAVKLVAKPEALG